MAQVEQTQTERHHGTDVTHLERIWIAAEARADRAKRRARRAQRAAAELSELGKRTDPDLTVLVGEAQRLAERRELAEQEAEAAFDRFWRATSGS